MLLSAAVVIIAWKADANDVIYVVNDVIITLMHHRCTS